MKYLLVTLVLVTLLSSCTIREKYAFNEDFSGTHITEFDFSENPDMGERMVAKFQEDTVKRDSMVMAMNAKEGISNASMTAENNVVRIAYDFAELTLVNTALKTDDMAQMFGRKNAGVEVNEGHQKFSLNGNVLSYTPEERESDNEAPPMGNMKVKTELIMSFAKPVKKVSNKEYKISKDRKTITFRVDMSELMAGNNGKTTITF